MFNRIVTAFGLLLIKLSERLKKKPVTLTSEDTETERTEVSHSEVKVHKIIAGPFAASDDPDFDPNYDMDYFWIDAMVEIDNEIMDLTIGHNEFDEIYKIVKHIKSPTVEPYVIGRPDE